MTGDRVHVVSEDGSVLFNGLLDQGRDRIPFEGGGFVLRSVLPRGARVVPGWLTLAEMDAERDRRWPGWRR